MWIGHRVREHGPQRVLGGGQRDTHPLFVEERADDEHERVNAEAGKKLR